MIGKESLEDVVISARTTRRTTWHTANLLNNWQELQPAWDEFVYGHPKGSAFHTSAMVRVFEAAKGHTPLPLAAVTDSGEILSLLVATRVQTLPNLFGAVSSRSIWYAEPLCHDVPDSIQSLGALIAEHDEQMRRRVLFAEVRPLNPSGPERLALERSGYSHLEYLNFILDTSQPPETLWNQLGDSTKSGIRKCERRRFDIRQLCGPESVDALYNCLRLTYGRADVPLADFSLFEAAQRILAPLNMIEVNAVFDGPKLLAAASMLLFNKQAFAWYGGSNRLTGVSPAAFLQWHELEWGHNHGIERYDFGGAGWPNVPYGVRDFKSQFGGELVCYGRYRKVYSRWKMALAERAYELGRTVISPKSF